MHGSTGSGKKHSHQALNIQVFRLCQKRGAVALVNFPMRVASNMKNGRYGQKNGGRTRSWTDYQGYRGWHYSVIVIVCRSLDFCRRWGNQERFKRTAPG